MESRQGLRIILLTLLVLVGFGSLVTRLYEFQIDQQDHYQALVPGDREITVREPGIRGPILDRHGIELARNRRHYEVYFDLEEIHQAYQRDYQERRRQAELVGTDPATLPPHHTDIARIVNSWIIPKLAQFGVAKNYSAAALRTHYVTHRGLVPFSYNTGLDYDQLARLAEHSFEVPGVYLDVRPQREYPHHALAAHILGYTQPWEKGDIPEDAKRQFDHYIGEEKGKAGIEATYNDFLRGPAGSRRLVKNDKGRITRMIDYRPPRVGATVQLTIDAHAQLLASRVLRRAGRAAAVVMQVETGEILAMASVPDYDPNDFIPSIDAEVWKAYTTNPTSPLTDRCISGFAPGSTLKLATAIGGALHGLADRRHTCTGSVSYGSYQPRCWKRSGHGTLDLASAIQRSCNPYFFKLSNQLGGDHMVDALTKLGFGSPTGIPLPNESGGIFAGSDAWRQAHPTGRLTPATLAQLSIGQGSSLATPLQLCAMVAAIANGGRYYQPRLVRRANLPDGPVLIEDQPTLRLDLVEAGVTPAAMEKIRRGMWKAVNEPGGTAARARIPGEEVAAKTGTAQTSDRGRKSHNSWTVAFAPYDSPRYAVAVLVQNGKSGGRVCGPLVHLILRGLLARDQGMRLPLTQLSPVRGNTDPIEEIELPENVLAAFDILDVGETGDEAQASLAARPDQAPAINDSVIPEPTITPEVDEEGSVIPRAIPVEEPN